ncbi:PEP-CTERM/exosortase A-associated glycosyltransferase, Daro_2409 family [Sphingomonas guangdongensis]|uniref:PEP-CTERM/exosortase A-associated glycosyltransferase, Daro_2409 family n=1 Tax=Sphingomonas guangdongensis TaxID=1141890 RepID=A0A285QYT1_9SPHN|nr:TIGR04063 family PEP-CTERM/XrtA system glycosyltransferase [Sphingomonas guangdongensis]SOB86529.1 PEP-CTERM/exosortase A-associated glycosyltransferase, Daro_2409 family [Sphingomonas guangdongensis]
MRILHVLDHGLPLHSGYTFRTRAIVSAQMRRGHQVAAITGPRQQALDVPFETVDGIDFYRTPPVNTLPAPFGELREVAHFARRIDEVVAEFRPDVLHAHSPVLDALSALRVSRRRNVPLLYEIRAFWEDAAVGNGTGHEGSARYRAIKALETWTAKRVDALAVICAGLRDDLIARGVAADAITVSPNGVDLTLFGEPPAPDAALAAELGVADAEVIGFIGSFYDYEGLDTLIAAMPALVARRPTLQLVLVGGGPVEEALRAQAAASPAAHAIHFVGRVSHAVVERYYSLIDVLVYPRRRMRLTDLVTPLKPLEAMAQGKLVAASNVGGHRELIRDGDTGTLFAADSPAALAARVADLFEHRSGWDAMRARGRAFVAEERDWARNVARYDGVYHKITAAAARKPLWLRSPSSAA